VVDGRDAFRAFVDPPFVDLVPPLELEDGGRVRPLRMDHQLLVEAELKVPTR